MNDRLLALRKINEIFSRAYREVPLGDLEGKLAISRCWFYASFRPQEALAALPKGTAIGALDLRAWIDAILAVLEAVPMLAPFIGLVRLILDLIWPPVPVAA